jgi:hypothetical protein
LFDDCGMAEHGEARLRPAWLGVAWRGAAWQGMDCLMIAAGHGEAWVIFGK